MKHLTIADSWELSWSRAQAAHIQRELTKLHKQETKLKKQLAQHNVTIKRYES